jgi:hypothetical protein
VLPLFTAKAGDDTPNCALFPINLMWIIVISLVN